MASKIVTEEQIRTAAYYIWLAEGQPIGHDDAHWHRARSVLEVSARENGEPASRKTRTKSKAAAPAAKKTAEKAKAPKPAGKAKARKEV